MFPDFVYAVACGRYHGQVCQSVVELGNVPAHLTTEIIHHRETHRGSPHSFPRTSPVWLLCLPRSRHLSHWIQMAQQETSQIILTLACFVNSHPQFYQESDSMCVWSQWSLLCDVTSCWCLCGSWYLCTLRHRPEPEQAPPCHQSRSFCHELDERGNIPIVNAVAECYHAMPMWIECKFFLLRFIVLSDIF